MKVSAELIQAIEDEKVFDKYFKRLVTEAFSESWRKWDAELDDKIINGTGKPGKLKGFISHKDVER